MLSPTMTISSSGKPLSEAISATRVSMAHEMGSSVPTFLIRDLATSSRWVPDAMTAAEETLWIENGRELGAGKKTRIFRTGTCSSEKEHLNLGSREAKRSGGRS